MITSISDTLLTCHWQSIHKECTKTLLQERTVKVISDYNSPTAPPGPIHGSIYFFTNPTHVQNTSDGRVDMKEVWIWQGNALLTFRYLVADITRLGSSLLFMRGGEMSLSKAH